MLKKLLLALCIGGLSLAAYAAENDAAPATSPAVTPAAQQMVRQAIKSLAANVQVDSIEPAPMPGFYQVIAAGQMLYVSTDGKYAMHGDVIDLSRKQNVSDDTSGSECTFRGPRIRPAFLACRLWRNQRVGPVSFDGNAKVLRSAGVLT
jgi:hypothetical protein